MFGAHLMSILIYMYMSLVVADANVFEYFAADAHFLGVLNCERRFYRPVDFLRKVLVLCCAFEGGTVSRPMFAAFVSLGFAFLHLRVWPYRRKETNYHKAISDFTICFVFYLCSIKAAGSPEDKVFIVLQLVIVAMWRVFVPISLVAACIIGVRRE